jgi:hypothetical protein
VQGSFQETVRLSGRCQEPLEVGVSRCYRCKGNILFVPSLALGGRRRAPEDRIMK